MQILEKRKSAKTESFVQLCITQMGLMDKINATNMFSCCNVALLYMANIKNVTQILVNVYY